MRVLLLLHVVAILAKNHIAMSNDDMVEVKRETLSTHDTFATYDGIEKGREDMLRVYPQRTPLDWSKFTILSYTAYEKTGKYGDAQAETFACIAADQSDSVQSTLATLAVGTRVRLAWHHDYVKLEDSAGRSSSSPERPVVALAAAER